MKQRPVVPTMAASAGIGSTGPSHARRALLVVGLFVLAVTVACLEFGTLAVVAVGTCDGDGGVPYSADDSPAGRFCNNQSRYGQKEHTFLWILPVLIAVVGGGIAVAHGRWRPLALAGAASLLALVLVLLPYLVLSDDCSAAQTRANEEWATATNRDSEPPYDCEKY